MVCKNWIVVSLTISILLFSGIGIFAQTTYSKVKINLEGKNIQELTRLGLETDHGLHARNRYWVHIFSQEELKSISQAGFSFKTIIDDYQANYLAGNSELEHDHSHDHHHKQDHCEVEPNDIDIATPENYKYGSMGGFFTYEELLEELDLMHEMYPNLVSKKNPISDIKTHDGDLIQFIRLSNIETDHIQKPQILYTALHHAREPTSLSQMIFYLWYMLENYDSNEEVRYLMDHTDMFFIPCINVDGYKHNHKTNPNGGGLWRKNRHPSPSNGNIVGVDLNRNYGYEWAYNDTGSSPSETSQVYRGPDAFSEPETQAVKEFCENHAFKIALNYHASGELLIYPWGFNDEVTDEDHIFKSMGESMTEVNDFKLGTASETVGYIVNGTSDDWMYGEQTTKNKIYAMTPEMGHTFWPQEDEIDDINKSSLRQNLNAARMTQNFVDCTALNSDVSIVETNGIMKFNLTKIGLGDGPIALTVVALSDGLQMQSSIEYTILMLGESEDFEINYQLDDQWRNGDEIQFEIQFDNGDYIWNKQFSREFLDVHRVEIHSDTNDDLNGYQTTGNWSPTTNHFVSSPSSITDSPSGTYQRNSITRITLRDPIDLSLVENAELRFHARWEIEDLFDFVQVEAGTNFTNFTPLCGKHSGLGEATQRHLEPLYDGVQESWVEEIISLEDYIGEEAVFIRFSLHSDFIQELDGFYFDDLQVYTYVENERVSVEDITNDFNITISPNPVNDQTSIQINPDGFESEMYYEIRTEDGRLIKRNRLNDARTNVNMEDLNPGAYILTLLKKNEVITSRKLIK